MNPRRGVGSINGFIVVVVVMEGVSTQTQSDTRLVYSEFRASPLRTLCTSSCIGLLVGLSRLYPTQSFMRSFGTRQKPPLVLGLCIFGPALSASRYLRTHIVYDARDHIRLMK